MRFLALGIWMMMTCGAYAQTNHIDLIRPDAPELAKYGDHHVGVRTLSLIDIDRPDILNTTVGGETARYDRALTVEIWYPASLSSGQEPGELYRVITRNLSVPATLHGRAVRDAAPDPENRFPLIVISHGYPGNRFLMAHLGENLASKGYVVASIDHLDSTYDDRQPFQSTLYNRPLDQRFVIDQIATATGPASFLGNSVDGENTAVIGYSMGGYGLVNNLGAGFNDDIVDSPFAPPNRLLSHHASGNPEYRPELDSRIKAGVAIAPWGMTSGIWRPEDLHAIKAPTLYVAGSLDRTAGYEDGVRAMFENAINSDRYLLTFVNAGHNAAAPMPVPVEILHGEDQTGSNHYTDPVWDTLRMNNILAHFVTAFLDHHLKQKPESRAYLDLLPNANDGVYSVDEDEPTSKHTYWKGFGQGTAHGLLLEHLPPGQ